MNPQVITLPAYATMKEAANLFADHEISGAPVVDETGRCIGVLSTADFACSEETESLCRQSSASDNDYVLAKSGSIEPYHIEHETSDRVSQHMTRAIQTIDAQSFLMDAARYMLGQHIHRLIVLGRYGRPVGILSSLDILAAIVGPEH